RRHRELTVTLPAGTWFIRPLALNRCLAIAISFGRRSVSSHVATTDSISLTGLVPRHRPHSRGEEHHIILDHQRREHTRRSTATPAS
ncbi:MAG: hypothetical protein E6788_01010, partial [Propionibacterium sp.]|nr:hypothetical protein [Propionibacterium sp.]